MKHNFKPYLNPVFIESGSYGGDGIMAALKAGFPKVISIELSEYYYILCRERYKQPNVTLYHGDSVEVLPIILKDITERCTFWLDGHFCGDFTAGQTNPVPLMEELLIIAKHTRNDHTIIIDDMRLLRTHDAEWKDLKYGIEDIENVVRRINPKYQIHYEKGLVKNDILVATI